MTTKYKRLKYGCYMSNVCMSIVSTFLPLLFVGFHDMYNISYTMLGALVFINFTSQLIVDLIYSIFSSKINIELSVKMMPAIMMLGLIIIALAPIITANNIYIGIVIGNIIISASSGIAEVLISRVIAAIPSENPDSEMSKLHSIFAFGCVATILISTLFIKFIGFKFWQILALILCFVPIMALIFYARQEFPRFVEDERNNSERKNPLRSIEFALLVFCIFLGGATENMMSQWISSYVDKALDIPKIYGDLFGTALFALFLGIGRLTYSKIKVKVENVLLIGSVLSTILYIISAVSSNVIVALIACALTGFTTSMLWPGTIIAATPKFAKSGVAMFAILAAGGDFGASIGPQLIGLITDKLINNATCIDYSIANGLLVDMVAMRISLLIMSIFPFLLIIITSIIFCIHKKTSYTDISISKE